MQLHRRLSKNIYERIIFKKYIYSHKTDIVDGALHLPQSILTLIEFQSMIFELLSFEFT